MLKTILLLSGLAALHAAEIPEATLKRAVTRALAPLEKQSPVFVKTGGCNSCHNQDLPVVAQTLARQRGIPTGADIVLFDESDATQRIFEHGAVVSAGSLGYTMIREAARKRPADSETDANVSFLLTGQLGNGRWDSRSNRQPLTTGDHFATAFGIFIVQNYARGVQREQAPAHVSRAVAWLRENAPVTNQDSAFQVLGLVWGKASDEAVKRASATLQSRQRDDGGWAQLSSMTSDAYATGQALYALALSGTPATHPAYRRGLDYLLKTQAKDGTWYVKARSKPVQPYFDSGFPYGHDQWISAAATSWAAMSITMAVDAPNQIKAGLRR
ncbi:MAG: hypothetical protein JJE04_08245 [Acidobacteriia bacterium]|nr:hypothetical protein [Terriglobia bacterium]